MRDPGQQPLLQAGDADQVEVRVRHLQVREVVLGQGFQLLLVAFGQVLRARLGLSALGQRLARARSSSMLWISPRSARSARSAPGRALPSACGPGCGPPARPGPTCRISTAKLRPVISMTFTTRRLRPAAGSGARKESGVHSAACDRAGSGPSGLAPMARPPSRPATKWSRTSQASTMSFSVSGSRLWYASRTSVASNIFPNRSRGPRPPPRCRVLRQRRLRGPERGHERVHPPVRSVVTEPLPSVNSTRSLLRVARFAAPREHWFPCMRSRSSAPTTAATSPPTSAAPASS